MVWKCCVTFVKWIFSNSCPLVLVDFKCASLPTLEPLNYCSFGLFLGASFSGVHLHLSLYIISVLTVVFSVISYIGKT